MGKYIKNFDTHEEYLTYSETYLKNKNEYRPNVSYCKDQQEIHYNGQIESIIKATFNVTSTEQPTLIKFSQAGGISEMYIDDTKQDSIVYSYQFNTTGEHEVKYKLQNMSYLSPGLCYLCSDLTSINMSDNITIIGDRAFKQCIGLTSINIPDSVTIIGASAFEGCRSLTSVNIPNSVTYIGVAAFNACENLTSIDLPVGVISIGTRAFQYCTGLTSVNIPDSVTSIGDAAFLYCRSLTSVNIPNSVTSISGSVFSDCTSLTSINLPNNITNIPNHLCDECVSLTSINIPDSVTSIGDAAFYNCYRLTSITCLPINPPTIGSRAFKDTNSPIYVPDESVEQYKTSWSQYADRIKPLSEKPNESV